MAREARVVAEGVPHHITQRGNNRQGVFLLDDDRRFYIEALQVKSRQHGLTILGYCLMTNHVHLVAIPKHPTSLDRNRDWPTDLALIDLARSTLPTETSPPVPPTPTWISGRTPTGV